MKTFLLGLFALITFKVHAATYYFSSVSGDDSRPTWQAQSIITPWKTLNKFNSHSFNFLPGDVILFKRGETFYGSMNFLTSGTPSLPITIGAYGTGAKPIITGLLEMNNWVSLGGNKYETTCSTCMPTLNMVTVQDTLQPIGRWPKLNTQGLGYLVISTHSGTSSISSNGISAAPKFIGGEVVIRPFGWIFNRAKVTSQTSSVVSYTPIPSPAHPNFTYAPQDGYGFFFQNHLNALTENGDWMYDAPTKKVKVYFSSLPPNGKVKVSAIENLIDVESKSNIIFNDLEFKGSNTKTFNLDGAANITVNNCEISLSGVDAFYVNSNITNNITIKNSTITNTNNNAITASGSLQWNIKNNLIRNTGMIRGMGSPGDGQYYGISHVGSKSIIENNVVKNSGYIGIGFEGDSTIIKNNFVDSFCVIKSDGGGIYTTSEKNKRGRKITGNIVTNGIGDRAGRSQDEIDNPLAGNVHGIYLDGGATHVLIDSNTSANISNSGLELSSVENVVVRNNTFFNNTYAQIFYVENNNPINNLTLKNNILFATKSDQLISLVSNPSAVDKESTWGTLDSNYYCRPISEPQNVDTAGYSHQPSLFDYPDGGIIGGANYRFYSLDRWKILSGQDANTKKTPNIPTDLTSLLFEINPTSVPKTIILNSNYFDVKGQFYSNSVTLAPYSSIILLKSIVAGTTAQTITFPVIASKTFGNAPFTIFATASSGLPVAFRVVSGPATLTGNTVTLTGAGSVSIEATQAGNATYAPATPVSRTFAIAKSSQTITFNSLPAKTYGDAPFNISASASSGLPVTFQVTSGPATISGNTVTLTNSGNVTIQALQTGNADYNAAINVSQSFIVNTPPNQSTCSATGSILREQWNNVFGTSISDIPLQNAPSSSSQLTMLETQNTGDNMGARIRGYICPPISGNYSFYLAGDDGVELYLSTSDNPSLKVKIAGYTGWTGFREWNKYPTQKSSAINLTAGLRYYIEVLHKNGGGGDHVSVKWDMPNGITETPIPGNRLSPFNATQTKTNQTITFNPIPSKTYGDAPFTISGNASSGLPVSFQVISGPATISGSTITLTGSGNVVIEANQAGNGTYNAAPPVTQSFSVAPGTSSPCSTTGSIVREQWNNVFGIDVSDIPVNTTPSSTSSILKLETQNTGDNMGARIRGYVCPPLSGNYRFYIAGDDGVELWLSTNADPGNKVKIAGYSGWTGFREWDKYPGQKSALINLQTGNSYYIEVLHKNGGGGDNVSVKWDMPNGVTETPIPGNRLSPYLGNNNVKINQSINFASLSSKTFGDPAFTVNATATSGLAVSFRIVSGPATISGNTITLTNSGNVVVEAMQTGNASYNAATPFQRSFVVNPAGSPTTPCSNIGSITREQWNNVFGTSVNDIPLNTAPNSIHTLNSFETVNTGDNMGARIRGYICPPISGNYRFYLAGDDGVELYLSTNDNPANKVKIAGYIGWTGYREWDKYPTQKSALINLQVGQSYYVEVLHKNGGGGDNVSVKWDMPNGVTETPILGSRLAPYPITNNRPSYTNNSGMIVIQEAKPEGKTDVAVYPNPFQRVTNLKITPTETGDATITLTDLQGRTLRQVFKGRLEKGQVRNFLLNDNGLSNGVYIIRLVTNNNVISKKVSLAK